jgi:exodeoxyribonuclease V alpha subunit
MPEPHPNSTAQAAARLSLAGVLEKIIYSNPETHFCVAELLGEDGISHTITGPLPNVQCGETLQLNGNWETHKSYGRQFKVASFESRLPASVYGIRKYLGSGLVPGIGKTYAKKIVDTFGEQTFDVIEEDSGRLREVPGIGAKRAREIKQAWDTQRAGREIMLFLQTYGVSVRNCMRLVKRYGSEAKQILLQDPYTTAREIDGIGFKTADQIARNLGFGFASAERIEAGLLHVVKDLEGEGHTALPRGALLETAERLLEVEPEKIEPHLGNLVENGHLVIVDGTDLLQLPLNRFRETTISQRLHRLLAGPSCLPPIKVATAIEWAAARNRIDFASEQISALQAALTAKVCILTGGPGTGKTTILRCLVDILKAKKVRIALASPTGRAAQRMAESTRHHASTLHRLLRFDAAKGGFSFKEDKPLNADFIIVDEASMLDCALATAFFRALPDDAHLLLVGDVNQLPSVGAGNVLKDIIAAGLCPVVRLQQVFRQREHSNIVTTAHEVLGGRASPPRPARGISELDTVWDFQFLATTEPEATLQAVERVVAEWIPQHLHADPLRDVQVLAPMHRGTVGIRNLNLRLQQRLNQQSASATFGDTTFRAGDRVIQTRNNYDQNIFNGDMGTIIAIARDQSSMTVDFDGNEVDLERMEWVDLDLAYAISIHKSQGSEFPIVVLPLLKQHFMLLQRNLLYTAITRGRRKVVVIGDPTAWAMAVRNNEQHQRHTGLPVWLAAGP